MKRVTVFHPDFPDVSEDVPAKDVKAWLPHGWTKTPTSRDTADLDNPEGNES